jgi:hypothetical protein
MKNLSFKIARWILLAFILFFYTIQISGCSGKKGDVLEPDPGASGNPDVDYSSELSYSWVGNWKGSTTHSKSQLGIPDPENWTIESDCSITISRCGPDQIFFAMSYPISIHMQITIFNDRVFSKTGQTGQYLFNVRGTKIGDVITGKATKSLCTSIPGVIVDNESANFSVNRSL